MDNYDIRIMIDQAQCGAYEVREQLIDMHQTFVKQIVKKNVIGYEEITSRDEYSIALIALNEAIDSYRPGFRTFKSFAASVIKKRLIDYYRNQKKRMDQNVYIEDMPSSAFDLQFDYASEKIDLQLEMQYFVDQLSLYGITLRDLVNESPKHIDSRLLCIKIAKTITGDAELKKHLLKYHTLPLKMLLKKLQISAKTVERHRKYIISICLVLLSDLDSLKEYVNNQFSQGGDKYVM